MKRPAEVTISGLLVLIFTSLNAIRTWTSLAWTKVLTEFSVSLPPSTSALIGAVWTLIGMTLFFAILLKTKWAGTMLRWAFVLYTAWYWGERFFIEATPRPNVLFGVIVNLTLFVIIFFASRSLTREAYERDNKNSAIE